MFSRWGVWAVFFGRFVALLRIFAGPLAGALKMRYSHFLAANASGAIVWAGGTTAAIYYVGLAAESFLKDFSWIALVVGALFALTVTLVLKERTAKAIKDLEAEHDWDSLRNG